ncbi:unnamed protein product [Caenorhabditis auriculariae]|uniref:Beta-lactamase-related domain-containing protein n=1 Tax=Caenorhabditis auriculariae TaxID=2777116 RepID=A0A8S1HTS9_9PELO|nr:unnamed protein product [Caenorhabditis auriculariae]
MWYRSLLRKSPVIFSATVLPLGFVALKKEDKEHEKRDSKNFKLKKIEARKAVVTAMQTAGIPGLSVGVTVDGVTVWAEGFGYANVETLTPCDAKTVMRIASISKPIAATIAARLVQEGKLDIDKDIKDYLPDYPNKKFERRSVIITTRQLLSHSGGIRHYKEENVETSVRTKVVVKLDSRNL